MALHSSRDFPFRLSFYYFLRAFLWSFFRGLNPVAVPHSWYFGGSSFQWSRVWTYWTQTHVFARLVVLAHIDFRQAACLHIDTVCGTYKSFTLGSFRTLLCNMHSVVCQWWWPEFIPVFSPPRHGRQRCLSHMPAKGTNQRNQCQD